MKLATLLLMDYVTGYPTLGLAQLLFNKIRDEREKEFALVVSTRSLVLHRNVSSKKNYCVLAPLSP